MDLLRPVKGLLSLLKFEETMTKLNKKIFYRLCKQDDELTLVFKNIHKDHSMPFQSFLEFVIFLNWFSTV